MCYLLREYSEKAIEEGESAFLISSSSFDCLKVLLDLTLGELDLSNGYGLSPCRSLCDC